MALSTGCKALLGAYNLLWPVALPALYLAPRLREGFAERRLRDPLQGYVDVWIQAASGGEAYLARELAFAMPQERAVRILATTNTRQGREVLDTAAADLAAAGSATTLVPAYCPFDQPALMRRAMEHYSPKALVLLETEIWPGLLAAAREAGVPTLFVNARMNPSSLAGYLCAGGLLRQLAPDRVLAVSDEASMRFSILFGAERVERMHNIKFDRFPAEPQRAPEDSPVRAILGGRTPVAGFASVRREEEPDVLRALAAVHEARPKTTLALFPRHMHRLDFWRRSLYEAGLPVVMRSELDAAPAPGSVVLWDAFGELGAAYEFCRAAFVGGSLRPLGGQNFLEPLSHGVQPVIGPHWSNFSWIGRDIVDQGLVREVADADELARTMVTILNRPPAPDALRAKVGAYVDSRRGGTAQAVQRIASHL